MTNARERDKPIICPNSSYFYFKEASRGPMPSYAYFTSHLYFKVRLEADVGNKVRYTKNR